jgi:hypothetical protein
MATGIVRKLQPLYLNLTSAGNILLTWALLVPIRTQLRFVLLCVCISLLPNIHMLLISNPILGDYINRL